MPKNVLIMVKRPNHSRALGNSQARGRPPGAAESARADAQRREQEMRSGG
jgi:hypothetical protein